MFFDMMLLLVVTTTHCFHYLHSNTSIIILIKVVDISDNVAELQENIKIAKIREIIFIYKMINKMINMLWKQPIDLP